MTATAAPIHFPSARALPEDVRKLVCNGIGPARGRGWGSKAAWLLSTPPLAFAYALGLTQAFRAAGDDHDLHYFMGGGWRDKRLADAVFLGQLLDTVSHWGPLLRPIGWAVAVSYWLAVAALGWGSFQQRREPLAEAAVPAVARLEIATQGATP